MHLSITGLLFLISAAGAPVEADMLDGETHAGVLQQLAAGEIQLLVDGQPVTLATGELQALTFRDADKPEQYDKEVRIEVDLTDGTKLYVTGFVCDSRTVTLKSPVLGEVSLPLALVRSVRLGQWESEIDADWQEMKERETEQDLLVVRKGDDLDFAGGVVGAINAENVSVLLGARELEIPRERVFGLVLTRNDQDGDSAICALQTEADDQLRLHALELRDDSFLGTLAGGTDVIIPVDQVQFIDFGLGRIRYLTELDPVASYEAVGLVTSEHVLKYRRIGLDDDPLYRNLVIGNRTFQHGLWIHSGTVLRYRLNRDFKRLQAVMGVNRSSYNCAQFDPNVQVRILADGRVVLDEVVNWGDDPQNLDIDVADVRDLEIHVTTIAEDPLGICEHLALAEARLIR